MNHAIRTFRANPPSVFLSPLPISFVGQKASRQVKTLTNPQNMETAQKMDPNNPQEKAGDVMSHSFGEGYATRSEEEGFGGIHGGNQTFNKDEGKEINENHPAYDKSQGSEVKEKEKARHQTNASN